MKLNEVFTSDYLRVDDLKRRRRTFTISDVTVEKIGEDRKPVIAFEETEKTLVLNKTNAMRIAGLLDTDDTDDWVGRAITLMPDETTFQGKAVPCIRVALELPDDEEPPRKKGKPPARRDAVGRNASAADREFEEDGDEPAF